MLLVLVALYLLPAQRVFMVPLLVAAATLSLAMQRGRTGKAVSSLVSAGAVMLVAFGTLSLSSATLVIGVGALLCSSPYLAVLPIICVLSTSDAAEQMIAGRLAGFGLEAMAPSALVVGSATVLRLVGLRAALIGLLAVTVTAMLLRLGLCEPLAQMAIIGGVALVCLHFGFEPPRNHVWRVLAASSAALFVLTTWVMLPPRNFKAVVVAMPTAVEAYEAQFFKDWDKTARWAGLDVRSVEDLQSVPEKSLLILPWTTAELSIGSNAYLDLRRLAEDRGVTILALGEHTDYGGNAKRINSLATRIAIADDLSVPLGNGDESGPLRTGDVREWPLSAVFNRGATVAVSSLLAKPLLLGDGWWSEPNRDEWLWVGDYRWEPGDHSGRLALASAESLGRGALILFGDNSMAINRQLVADPRPFFRAVELASLWPSFARDVCTLILLMVAVTLPLIRKSRGAPILALVPMPLALLALIALVVPRQHTSPAWADQFLSTSAFDSQSFASQIAADQRLQDLGWSIKHEGLTEVGEVLVRPHTVHFARVRDGARIGSTTIKLCWRIGSLAVPDGPRVIDGQACELNGEQRVLVGSKSEAAAIAVKVDGAWSVVVFDVGFLRVDAPKANMTWLAEELISLDK